MSENVEMSMMERVIAGRNREPVDKRMQPIVAPPVSGQSSDLPHGFGPMSRITTAMGPLYAQTLRKGDRVKTKSGEFLPIVAIKRIVLDADFLTRHPTAMPVLVRAGAFSRNLPASDMILAPNQKIHQGQAMMGPVCNNAQEALRKPGVMRKSENMITYTTFHCGRPAVVNCEGMWMDTAP